MLQESSSSHIRRDTDGWRPTDSAQTSHDHYKHSSEDGHSRRSREVLDYWEPAARPYGIDHESESSTFVEASWPPDRVKYDRWRGDGADEGSQGEKRHKRFSEDRQDGGWTRGGRRDVPDSGWRTRESRHAESLTPAWDESTSRQRSGAPAEASRDGADSGWKHRESRHGESLTPSWDEPPSRQWSGTHIEGSRHGGEDRSWEPSASWQPNSRSQSQRNQKSSKNIGHNRGGKGKKNNKQKRDWRADDSQLNNWTRRDDPKSSKKIVKSSKRRQRRSLSRGRSRSPAESYYSRRSSRDVHRLPMATPISAIPLDKIRETAFPSGKRDMYRSRASTNGKRSERRYTSPQKLDKHDKHSNVSATMPPPSSVPAASEQNELRPRSRSSSPAAPHGQPPSPALPRISSTKNAGFKPIGQPSSAVKRFFPGDEDDESEPVLRRQPPLITPPPSIPRFVPSVQAPQSSLHISFTHDPTPSQQQPGDIHSVNRAHDLQKKEPEIPIEDQSKALIPQDAVVVVEQRVPLANGNGHVGSSRPSQALQREHDVTVAEYTRPSTPVRYGVYDCLNQVGEGTFGQVWKARNSRDGRFVALKKIRMEAERDGFPVTAMREIKLLQSLRHDNVVQLYEMMVSNGSVFMVFEYMDHDLTGVLSQTQFTFTEAHLKSFCRQMLAGLAYLHHKGVIHRDIKGSNILINNRGELKLGDFGLARFYQKRRRSDYTNRVITLWYRPPELLLGTTVYGPEVDMWSAGCIMLELFTKKPVFQGNDEIHQLDVIYKILGTPVVEHWPGMMSLPWYELVKPKETIPNHFRQLFEKWLSPMGLDLAERLLTYDPARRVTAVQALEAPYFNREPPSPAAPVSLSTMEGEWHEFEAKRERAKKRRKVDA
ncbi:uncharacterized protein FIBRA_03643 [Fibroporia radiculosa]|uniref:Protein kinase domain-containing protein n=1 Tax=Fibroporia radiculosa TaxID=599839 RepID=J4G636_9APHY|nr:uncharacterized protein FIBRA_03643 [Fibroporia radiculosa]CCM01583.1 predicted protein [Fibroporia radiculosa]